MNVVIHKSINEIDEKEWDSIVEKNRLICTHSYIKAIEQSNINDCRYFYPVFYDKGEIVAHTSIYFISTELDLFAKGFLKNTIDIIRRGWKGFFILRSIECGTPVSLGNTISFKEGVDRVEIMNLLCAETERIAADIGAPVLLFRDFYDHETGFFDLLKKRGYSRINNLPNTKIEIKWKSFDDYLSSMRSQYRYKVIDRMNAFRTGGFSMEVVRDFSLYADDLERLCKNVYDNAKEYKRERLPAEFFKSINTHLEQRSAVILIRRDSVIVGFTLLFFDHETLIPIFSGLDYDYSKEYAVYFNLLYKIVEVAIESGKKEVDLGITTLVPKKEIGADVVPLHMYMKHSKRIYNRIVPKLFSLMTPQDTSTPRSVFKRTASKKKVP